MSKCDSEVRGTLSVEARLEGLGGRLLFGSEGSGHRSPVWHCRLCQDLGVVNLDLDSEAFG